MVHPVCHAGGYCCSHFLAQLKTLYVNSASFCALQGQGSQGSPSSVSIPVQARHTKIVFINFSVPLAHYY